MIVYGELRIDWADVAAFLSFQYKQADKTSGLKNLEYFHGKPVVPLVFDTTKHLLEFRERFFVKRVPINLFEALSLTLKAKATDPRDKIFALLGLCHDGSTFVPVPNYKQSLESIVADMSKVMIKLNKTLDLICLKGTLSTCSDSQLPTWTSNWPALWAGSMTLQEKALIRAAQGPSTESFTDGFNNQEPKVQGHCLGTIIGLSSAMRPHNRQEIMMQPRSPWISLTKSLHLNKPQVYKDPPLDSLKVFYKLVRTLSMGRLSERRKDYWDLADPEWCFELLWTAEGRGSVDDIALIEWIDYNAVR